MAIYNIIGMALSGTDINESVEALSISRALKLVRRKYGRLRNGYQVVEISQVQGAVELEDGPPLKPTEEIAKHQHRIIYTKYEPGKIVNYCDN